MITQHVRLAQALAGQLGLPGSVRDAVGAAYEQWDGHGACPTSRSPRTW